MPINTFWGEGKYDMVDIQYQELDQWGGSHRSFKIICIECDNEFDSRSPIARRCKECKKQYAREYLKIWLRDHPLSKKQRARKTLLQKLRREKKNKTTKKKVCIGCGRYFFTSGVKNKCVFCLGIEE